MVEDAIIQLTDDQGDVVVEPVNSEHPLLELRTTWTYARAVRRRRRHDVPPDDVPTRDSRPTVAHAATACRRPKSVTVDTQPRRDHDVPVRYLDDNEWHDIVEAAGPDRVSGGQWSTEYSREYFRCVREDGMMVWLFHGSQQQTTDWFLHGWWD